MNPSPRHEERIARFYELSQLEKHIERLADHLQALEATRNTMQYDYEQAVMRASDLREWLSGARKFMCTTQEPKQTDVKVEMAAAGLARLIASPDCLN